MTASALFKAGRLQEAIASQTQEVKAHPADQDQRLFLFELLAFAGDLERAIKQLTALDYNEVELQTAHMAYRKLLDAEAHRRKLFADGAKPHALGAGLPTPPRPHALGAGPPTPPRPQFFVDPPQHVDRRLEALNCLRANQLAEAARLLAQADAAAPPLKGTLNGKPFESLRDADDVFGPVLEVLAHGNYYWVPLEQVISLTMKPPRFPRDLLWIPAKLEMAEAAGDVFVPALYPGSHEHADDAVKLGRKTDWNAAEGGPVQGVGLRTFLVGEDASSILEWRELSIG